MAGVRMSGEAAPVELGLAIPQAGPTSTLRRFLDAADANGIASLWVHEDVVGPRAELEPLAVLSYAAARTQQARLGVAVLLTPVHSPVHLAKELATVDGLADGRLVAGIGLGASTAEYPSFGVTAAGRASRFEEGIHVLRQLLTGAPVTWHGRHFDLDDIQVTPAPVQDPLPIWIGGGSDRAVRRAARLGDGYVGGGAATTKAFAGAVEAVQLERETAGDRSRDFTVAKRVYVAHGALGAAESSLQRWLDRIYRGRVRAAEVGAIGDLDAIAAVIVDVVRAGATTVVVNPVEDEVEWAEGWLPELMELVARS